MSDVIEEPTPTQEIWKDKEEELKQKYNAAFDALYWAAFDETKYREAGRDEEAAKAHERVIKANEQINAIVALQKQAHAAAMAHVVRRTYHKVSQRVNAAR